MENEPRSDKVAVVAEVREHFASSQAVFLTEYRGLTVSELAALRDELVSSDTVYKIYKNTLVRLAAREQSVALGEELLIGPTAIAFVKGDAAAAAKALRNFAKENDKLVLKGGLLGEKVLSPADTDALAKLPSREVLLAKLAGGMAAPMQQFAGLLQAVPRDFAYGLTALIDKRNAEAA